ncbi:MAG: tripartite tricarboxylate transporter substrate binding protein [Pigmentiphaga sp.]|nr:tripartite tricarboxylate transporter substrate binding protein [Pigmentiphaga sp.]
MQSPSLHRLIKVSITLFCSCFITLANAQYPARPITLVVPFAPGGANDAVARVVAKTAGESLGVAVIIDNKGGAGGTIGSEFVARADPDGYTLLLASAAHAINGLVYPNLRYDGIKDFTPIIQLTASPYILVVGKSLKAQSLAELISMAREAPGHYTYASSGTGSAPHLAGALLGDMAKVALQHVPYKGGSLALIDVIRGEVSMYYASLAAAAPHLKTGAVRALAVSTTTRVEALPDVPTVAEAGVAGYDLAGWYGVLAPAGTPSAVVKQLNTVFAKALEDPAVKQQLAMEGNVVAGGPPDELAQLIKSDTDRFSSMGKLVKPD